MLEKRVGAVSIWFFKTFLKYDNVLHFVSSRVGGVSKAPYAFLNLGFHVGDDPQNVLQNRKLLASTLGIPLDCFTTAKQIHDGNVKIITEQLKGCGAVEYGTAVNATDAMVTNVPDICLMILVADCVPILFYDPKKRVIGCAHAGWRGTVKLVAQNTVRIMQEKFSSLPEDIIVGIGPSIGPHCYVVGEEVVAQVKTVSKEEGEIHLIYNALENSWYFNLWEANKAQLLQMGIPAQNIEMAGLCTYCNSDKFFSARHQRGKTGRFGVGIMLKDE